MHDCNVVTRTLSKWGDFWKLQRGVARADWLTALFFNKLCTVFVGCSPLHWSDDLMIWWFDDLIESWSSYWTWEAEVQVGRSGYIRLVSSDVSGACWLIHSNYQDPINILTTSRKYCFPCYLYYLCYSRHCTSPFSISVADVLLS